jgi:glutaredoxin 3
MNKIVMYSTQFCPYCVMAEKLLLSKGADKIEKVRIDLEPERKTEMLEKTGRRTVPQIYIGETHVGGYDDLAILNKNNELTKLLAV